MCSSGGHLLLLRRLESWWAGTDRVWVSFRKTDAESALRGERVVWAHHPTQRNIPNLLRNLRLAWVVLRRERPDVVVSTGAGVAVPFFVVARLLRVKTVFIEAYERITNPSLTARICYPLSDLFLLQWAEQQAFFRRGRLIGTLL